MRNVDCTTDPNTGSRRRRRGRLAGAALFVALLAACTATPAENEPYEELPLIPVTEPAGPSAQTSEPTSTEAPEDDLIDRFQEGEIYPSDLAVFLLPESNWQNFLYPEVYERLGDGAIFSQGDPVDTDMESTRQGLDYRVGWTNLWSNAGLTFRLGEEIHILGGSDDAQTFFERSVGRFATTGVGEYTDPEFDSLFRQGALGSAGYVSYYSVPADPASPGITGGCEAVAFGVYANVVLHARLTTSDCLSGYVYVAASLVSAAIERIQEGQALLG